MPARNTVPAEGSGGDAAALEALGHRLRDMRRARGMTQASVAEVLNCDHSAVSRIESGTYPLTPQMLRAVERLLSLAAADGYETWFISYLEIERTATVLRTWEQAVLRRRTGGAEVMREQLGRLVAVAQTEPRVTVQVLPFASPGCAGMLAPFVVASFAPDPRPDVAYLDNALDGATTERRDQVARLALLYDALAREALSPNDSAELIKQVMMEWT